MYKEKRKVIPWMSGLGASILFLYSFLQPFDIYLFPNFQSRLIILTLGIVCIAAGKNFIVSISPYKILNIWTVILVFFIVRNSADLQNGLYSNLLNYLIIFLFYIIVSKNEDWIPSFFRVIKVMSFIYAIFTVLFYFSRKAFEMIALNVLSIYSEQILSQYNEGWMSGLTNHYSVNAMYLSLGLALELVVLLDRNKRKNIDILISIFLMMALFMTGKRGHIIFCIISWFVVYYFSNADKKRGRIVKILAILTIGVIVFMILENFVPFLMIFIERFKYQMAQGDVTTGRGILAGYAWELFRKNIWSGIGWNRFIDIYVNSYSVSGEVLNVHNVYLQLLTETGIFGFLAFVIFFIVNYYIVVKTLVEVRIYQYNLKEKDRWLMFSLLMQTFFLIYCMTGNPLYDVHMFFPYMAACAIAKYIRGNIVKVNNKKKYLKVDSCLDEEQEKRSV